MPMQMQAQGVAKIHGMSVEEVLMLAGIPGAPPETMVDEDIVTRSIGQGVNVNVDPASAFAEQQQLVAQIQQRNAAVASVAITSGYNFEGYRISRYAGYISGDGMEPVPDGMEGMHGANVLNDIVMRIRQTAVLELKEAAFALGCNAVIGLDFDYINIDSTDKQYLFGGGGTNFRENHFIGLTANGTAVLVEPIA
jgi:uncharacterized protein YbjQ (UPF0145 family)